MVRFETLTGAAAVRLLIEVEDQVCQLLAEHGDGHDSDDVLMGLADGTHCMVEAKGSGAWAVLQTYTKAGQKHLQVWLAWAVNEGLFESFFAFLDAVAKDNGCAHIEFLSSRKGWERVVGEYGFRSSPAMVTYTKEVA